MYQYDSLAVRQAEPSDETEVAWIIGQMVDF